MITKNGKDVRLTWSALIAEPGLENWHMFVLLHSPVCMSIYQADEDYPAFGKFFVDAAADHYLSIEDPVTVGDLVLSMLEKRME